MKNLRRECLIYVKLVEAGDCRVLNPDYFCLRGLENFRNESTKIELATRRSLYKAVIFQEQFRQRIHGTRDPERYTKILAKLSKANLRRAQDKAQKDRQDAYNIFFPQIDINDHTSDMTTLSLLLQLQKDLHEWDTQMRFMEVLQQSVHKKSGSISANTDNTAALHTRLQRLLTMHKEQFGSIAA